MCFPKSVFSNSKNLIFKTKFLSIKNNGVVHYYDFVDRNKSQFKKTIDLIKLIAKKHKAKIRVLEKRVARSTSSKEVHVAVDFKVLFQ